MRARIVLAVVAILQGVALATSWHSPVDRAFRALGLALSAWLVLRGPKGD